MPEIMAEKKHLDVLKDKEYIKEWQLPYENILTTPIRRDSRHGSTDLL